MDRWMLDLQRFVCRKSFMDCWMLDLQRFVCRIPLSDQFPRPGMLRTDCALFLDVLVRQVYYIMYLLLISPPPYCNCHPPLCSMLTVLVLILLYVHQQLLCVHCKGDYVQFNMFDNQ